MTQTHETITQSTLDTPSTSANLFSLAVTPNEVCILLQEFCPRTKPNGEAEHFDRKNLHFWRMSPQTAKQLSEALKKALSETK